MEVALHILGELKRRNVFRVGMAYIVAAWVLVQIGDIAAENFEAPVWVMKMFMSSLFAAFPIVIFFSWAYEMTPEGIKKASEVDPTQSISGDTGRKLDYITMGLLVVVVGVVALERFMPKPPGIEVVHEIAQLEAEPEPEVEILENSIAVLPFVNMSAEADQDYFSDGLTEELLNVLTHVEGLNVASRTSSFAFKGSTKNIQQIATALRVANILEGSVRKVGNRLRITAQLIDTSDDRHLWSDSYDRDMTDIFQIQDEIANAIVSALTRELGIGLQAVSVQSATTSLDAYDLYLKARELFIARKNLDTSWELLEKATEMDPQFARAWEALAAVHSVTSSWFPGDGIDHSKLALAAAHTALEIDPDLSMAYAVIGMEFQTTGAGLTGAIKNLDRAIENDQKNATAWLWRGIMLKDMGYMEMAASNFEQCLEIDAGYQNCRQHLAESLLALGKIESAIEKFEATIEENFHSTDDAFVSYYVHTGQRKMALLVAALSLREQFAPVKDWIEAIENPLEDQAFRIARFNKWGETHNIDMCDMGMVAIALQQESCFSTLENTRLMWHPDTAYFRKKPAFKDFVNLHFMSYWKENGFPPQCRPLDDGDFECA